MELVRKAEKLALMYDPENGFYNTFSGGKDSQALYHVLEISGVAFHTTFSPTTVDPPEVIRFIRKHYPEVEFGKVDKSMYELAVEKGMLPSMTVRYCCKEYKESAGAGKVTTIGIRASESSRRAKRHEVEITGKKFSGDLDGLEAYREQLKDKKWSRAKKAADGTIQCIHGKESLLISPIFDWTDSDVWTFLNNVMQVPHCCLYDEGYHRIGCVICPMSTYRNKVYEIKRYPHNKHLWIKAIMDIRRGGGAHKKHIHSKLTDTTTKSVGYKQNILNIHDNEQTLNELRIMEGGAQMVDELNLPYPKETVESFNNEYTQEEIDIAEAIFAWWISGEGYSKWYAKNISQQKMDFGE